nr:hypothetical protein [Pseudoxanthomonas sp.]
MAGEERILPQALFVVIPAKAGIHCGVGGVDVARKKQAEETGIGPGFRRDDGVG